MKEQASDSPQQLGARARRGIWGDANEARAGEEAVSALVARCDQLEAEVKRYRVTYGEMIVDPVDELRRKMMDG